MNMPHNTQKVLSENLPNDTKLALEELRANPNATPMSMPPSFYKDEAMMTIEVEELFINGWLCVGRAEEVPEIGDYYTLELFGEPLIVTRNSGNDVVVLSNVCRHRGSQLLTGKGNNKRITCPYHRWSYDLDGHLLAAPLVDKTEGFEKKHCSLPNFKTHLWFGWVFVNLSGTADEFEASNLGANQYLENYHPEEMRSIQPTTEEWQVNWKCLAENFLEGYHLTPVHLKTLHPMVPTRLCEKIPAGEGYTGYKAHFNEKYEGRTDVHPDMSEEECRKSQMIWVYPGFVVAMSPNSAVYMSITPTGPTDLKVRWDVIAREATFESDEAQNRYDFAASFNAEDRDRLLDVQKGMSSRYAKRGYLAPIDLEGTVWDFYKFMSRKLLD